MTLQPPGKSSTADEVVVGHADFDLTLPGRDARLSFLWRPYPWNVTEALLEEVPALPRTPSVVIASFCLWHALHVRDADAFAEDAAELSAAAAKVGEGWGWVVWSGKGRRKSQRAVLHLSP